MARRKVKARKAVWGADFKTDPMNPFYAPPDTTAAKTDTIPAQKPKNTRTTFGALKARYRYGDEGE